MRKIVHINVASNWGSTGKIVENIGLLANVNGYESYVLHSARFYRKSSLKTICCSSKFEERIHALKSLFFDAHGLGSMRATKQMIKKIELIAPDIIHLHNIHGYYINYAVLFDFLKKNSIPVVWTLHDCWAFTGHCAHFSLIGCKQWQSSCINCPQKESYPQSLVDHVERNFYLKKHSFLGVSKMVLVPVSNWLADNLRNSFLKSYPIHRIYNGIDSNIFRIKDNKIKIKEKYNISLNKFVLLGVASVWNRKKGLNDFITLSRMLPNDICIVLVGLNSSQKKKMPPNILGIQRTNNVDELADLYSCADLFLNLTYEDTFPTTNLESLACGTPVLTYNTGGSPESIKSGIGYIVEQGNLLEVLSCIHKIREQSFVNKAACRQFLLDHFKQEDRYQEYIDLYENLIQK